MRCQWEVWWGSWVWVGVWKNDSSLKSMMQRGTTLFFHFLIVVIFVHVSWNCLITTKRSSYEIMLNIAEWEDRRNLGSRFGVKLWH